MHPSTIGSYQIQRELGRGGMGVVYLAVDSKLDRQVAIKALPGDLASDQDRLARFQREAKVLASLNHSNVGGIYGLEQAEGQQYLVLEFIDGTTLAARLANGAIPIDESLALAKQIAEALEAAHEKGIVHRDLKPGNVMVTPDGLVKVLDFGLARTGEGGSSSSNVAAMAASPTVTSPPQHSPTIPGVIMGSVGYMSPEQARGKPVDKRSDIFSFGCVLYEMLTGAGPFPGETVTDALGAILHREPNWALLPPATPARVRELLTSCLAKDRKGRLHDIGDARLELERSIARREWTHTSATTAPKASSPRMATAAVAGLLLLGAGVLAGRALVRTPPPAPLQPFHVSTTVPAKPDFGWVAGIAPDARFVVYKAWPTLEADSTKPAGVLVVRRLDRDETKVIDGTEGVTQASLSADGRWIAFVAVKDRAVSRVTLKKIALEDGRPIGQAETLCELPTGGDYTLCWSSDREIVVASGWQQTILAVSAAGGEPRVVLKEGQIKEIDNWYELRPLNPGKTILASRWALVGQTIKERTEIVDLATGQRTPLLDNAGGAQLVDANHIVARRNQNSLIAARIDPATSKIVGEPVTVYSGSVRNSFFVSASGTLALSGAVSDLSGRKLMWLDAQGQTQPVGSPARAYGSIAFSPDGGRIATTFDFAEDDQLPTNLWVHDLSRRTFTRIPTPEPTFQELAWSPDGERITYGTITNQAASIWTHRADGSGEAVKLFSSTRGQELVLPRHWSSDGKTLAALQINLSNSSTDVLMLEQDPGGATWSAKPYLNSPANEDGLRFSPDNRWVLFVTAETGRSELYMQKFTGAGAGQEDAKAGRKQISTGGITGTGWWSQDGKEIRYTDSDSRVLSVQVQTEPTWSVSLPKVLYSLQEYKTRHATTAPDGRMMLVMLGENEQVNRIDLVVNFLDELRAKVSAAK